MKSFVKFLRRLFCKSKQRSNDDRIREEEELVEEEVKNHRRKALCAFFERRGYEYYTRTPIVKMGNIYPDLSEFMPPTENVAWKAKLQQLYPGLTYF